MQTKEQLIREVQVRKERYRTASKLDREQCKKELEASQNRLSRLNANLDTEVKELAWAE